MSDTKVLVFCPCSEAVESSNLSAPDTTTLDSFPTTILNNETNHLLSYLAFCETCQAVKCRRCTELEIVTKYCPKCMMEMKPEYNHCSRNCFNCPICDSHINIHQKSSSVRVFKFKCVSCDYDYETDPLDKPRSLSKVINAKLDQTSEFGQFEKLKKFYIQRKQLQLGLVDPPKDITLQFERLRVDEKPKIDINEFIRRSVITEFDHELDNQLSIRLQSTTSNKSIIPLNNSIDLPVQSHTATHDHSVLPKSTRLRTKQSKRCKACRTSLMKPDSDPYSTKFYKLSNAIDYLPSISIHRVPDLEQSPTPRSNLRYFLNFKNPTEKELELKISTFGIVPGDYEHRVNIPISSFRLGGKPENVSKLDVYIKTVSSLELTKLSKLSRVELMNRKIAPSINFENVYEKGVNFIVVPIMITLAESFKQHRLRIPLFISVKSEKFRFGYWSVLDFGDIGE